MSTVSVIIPTYNRPRFLSDAIASVLAQTHQSFEIIVVDDASLEGVAELVDRFKDQRIRCLRHAVNRGEAESRNSGLTVATGEYIAFLDDDDTWVPDKLATQLKQVACSDSKTDVFYSGYTKYDDTSKSVLGNKIPAHRGDVYHALLKSNVVGGPSTVLVKRACVERTGLFDPSIAYGLDYDYWLRLARNYHFDFIAEPLTRYRLHENNLTKNRDLVAQGADDMERKYGRAFIRNNDAHRRRYSSLGLGYWSDGNRKLAVRSFMLAISREPTRARNYPCIVLSVLGPRGYHLVRGLNRSAKRLLSSVSIVSTALMSLLQRTERAGAVSTECGKARDP